MYKITSQKPLTHCGRSSEFKGKPPKGVLEQQQEDYLQTVGTATPEGTTTSTCAWGITPTCPWGRFGITHCYTMHTKPMQKNTKPMQYTLDDLYTWRKLSPFTSKKILKFLGWLKNAELEAKGLMTISG